MIYCRNINPDFDQITALLPLCWKRKITLEQLQILTINAKYFQFCYENIMID